MSTYCFFCLAVSVIYSLCAHLQETLYQSAADGTPFVDVLRQQGILPGIKVDTGLQVTPSMLHTRPVACWLRLSG